MSLLKQQKLERQVKKLEAALSIKEIEHDQNMTALNDNWSLKFSLVVSIFEAALNDSGTLGEAKRWFKEWSNDVGSLEDESDIKELIDNHGFEFDVKSVDVSWRDMI